MHYNNNRNILICIIGRTTLGNNVMEHIGGFAIF